MRGGSISGDIVGFVGCFLFIALRGSRWWSDSGFILAFVWRVAEVRTTNLESCLFAI